MDELTKKKLIEFALQTLGIMEEQTEWSSDTLDDIAQVAFNLHLATADKDCHFWITTQR
jgi:hypothetical protein